MRQLRASLKNNPWILTGIFLFAACFFMPDSVQALGSDGELAGVSDGFSAKVRTSELISPKVSAQSVLRACKDNLKKDGFKSKSKLFFGKSSLNSSARLESRHRPLIYKALFPSKYLHSFPIHAPPVL